MTSLVDSAEKVAHGYQSRSKIAAWSPTGKFHYDYFETSSANIKPGMPVFRVQGSTGNSKCTETAGSEAHCYGIAEFDENLTTDVSTAYSSGKVIPIISFHKNRGAYLRNVMLENPAANLNPDVSLCAGSLAMVLMTAFTITASGAGNTGFAAGATRVNGTVGTHQQSIEKMKLARYLANPAAAAYVAAYII